MMLVRQSRNICVAACVAGFCIATATAAQTTAGRADSTASLLVRVTAEGRRLPQAIIRSGTARVLSDSAGEGRLHVRPGTREVIVAKIGFRPETLSVTISGVADTTIHVELRDVGSVLGVVIVNATRADRSVEDEPVRVEVIPPAEVNEEVTLHPGEVARLLGEANGIRIQSTSSTLGGAGVRILGMQGRHTQFLLDGMPLAGSPATSLAPLQISPLDLEQVEIIRGAASALYGPWALGGVVDLISRRPTGRARRDLLVNQTSHNGTDAVAFSLWAALVNVGIHRARRAAPTGTV